MSLIDSLQDEVSLPASSNSSGRSRLLVYFIPGNPGLVEYYHEFLKNVRSSLSTTNQSVTTIYGASHDGFEVHAESSPTTSHGHPPPFCLEEVISGTIRKISTKAKEIQRSSGTRDDRPVRVVLIGHSVGSYILLEVLTWWHKQQQQQPDSRPPFTIISGIALFPTILHISASSKGRALSLPLRLPFLPSFAQFLARTLAYVPLWLWNWPRTFTPSEKRAEHCAVTEAVLRSRHGAKQVVYLAAEELASIREDKWHPSNLWGVLPHQHIEATSEGGGEEAPLIDVTETEVEGDAPVPRTKLFFYWGENDYWVDNRVRDNFIAQRANREGDRTTKHWPVMLVDRHGMDHCFSLNEEHSKLVGRQVAEWIEGLQESI